jgi:hypothetical protein
MATPKSDIVQAASRIFRRKHTDVPPVIIDVADQYSIFCRQAASRMRFYRRALGPCTLLNEPKIWVELIKNMPITALLKLQLTLQLQLTRERTIISQSQGQQR